MPLLCVCPKWACFRAHASHGKDNEAFMLTVFLLITYFPLNWTNYMLDCTFLKHFLLYMTKITTILQTAQLCKIAMHKFAHSNNYY